MIKAVSTIKCREANSTKEVDIFALENNEIRESIISRWQNSINILAKLADIPAVLIMKINEFDIEVFLSSHSPGNPYLHGAKDHLLQGFYCETVIATRKKLDIPNAVSNEHWKDNPDIKLNMIAYLGYPLLWPGGEVFGTVCMLDKKENHFSPLVDEALKILKESIETDLNLIVSNFKLKENEQKFRLLTETSSDVVWITQFPDLKFTYVSPAVFRLRGYTVEEIMAQSLMEWFTPESILMVGELMEKESQDFLTSGGAESGYFHNEAQIYHKDGTTCWVESTTQFQVNKYGEIEVHGVTRSIEKRKTAEFELIRNQEELIKLNANKDKFFSILAHDLRGPFQGFLGLTEILYEDLPEMGISAAREMAFSMHNAANYIHNLLENLLEWSRMQRGQNRFNPTEVNLSKLIMGVKDTLSLLLVSKETELKLDIPENIFLFADENMLNSIIRNLITNANKFTARGGQICISLFKEDGFVKITVADTGLGMSKEIAKNLFKTTGNTIRNGTEGEKSSGLGLLLVKEFVDRHNGFISVLSEENKGSTFILSFPIKS